MEDVDSDRRILVLNRLWQPVNIIGVRRCFSILSQDNAQVINTSDGSFQTLNFDQWLDYCRDNPPAENQPFVSTVNIRIRVPAVVLLRFFDRVPIQQVKFNRKAVFDRDGHSCQYCGRDYSEHELTLDHVIPRDQGGVTSWENIVTSCIYCNSEKANRMPHQAGMRLLKKPAKPKGRSFAMLVSDSKPKSDWSHFMRQG